MIDVKLRTPFTDTSKIYASAKVVSVGDIMSPAELVERLRRAGFSESSTNRLGWYHVRPDAIEIIPGPDAIEPEAGVVKFSGAKISGIVSTQDRTARTQLQLEPELITNLSDRNREKRRIVRYDDIPKILVEAILSAEDKRFFQHAGFDLAPRHEGRLHRRETGDKTQGAWTLACSSPREFGWTRTRTGSAKPLR